MTRSERHGSGISVACAPAANPMASVSTPNPAPGSGRLSARLVAAVLASLSGSGNDMPSAIGLSSVRSRSNVVAGTAVLGRSAVLGVTT